jgi:mono/diheme cytochrome c family protein
MTYTFSVRAALAAGAVAVVALAACSHNSSTPAAAAPAPSSNAAAAKPAGLPSGVTLAMVSVGDSIYHARGCRNCHGADAKGATNGPSLLGPTFMHVSGGYDDFVKIITTGVPADQIMDPSHHIPMPVRGGGRPAPLTDDQIRDVAAYVYSLSHK